MPTVVPEPRFELGRSCEPRSLSPLRLPFRHSGRGQAYPRQVNVSGMERSLNATVTPNGNQRQRRSPKAPVMTTPERGNR